MRRARLWHLLSIGSIAAGLIACSGRAAAPAAPASAAPASGTAGPRVAVSIGPDLRPVVTGLPAVSPAFDEIATAEPATPTPEGASTLHIVVFDRHGTVLRQIELIVAAAGTDTTAQRRALDAQLARIGESLRSFIPMQSVVFGPAVAAPDETLAPGTLQIDRDGQVFRFDPSVPGYSLSAPGSSSGEPLPEPPEGCTYLRASEPRAWEVSTDDGRAFVYAYQLTGPACREPGVRYHLMAKYL